MKTLLTAAALAALCCTTSACAVMDAATKGNSGATARDAILQDLQTCKRSYQGSLGLTINGSFTITCDPVIGAKPATPAQAGTNAPPAQ